MSEYDDLLSQVRSGASNKPNGANEYDQLLTQVRGDSTSAVQASLYNASFANPVEASSRLDAANKLKAYLGEEWAPSIVDPAEAQRRLRIAENDHVLRNSPTLSRKFIESGYAERTFDDVKPLAEVERVITDSIHGRLRPSEGPMASVSALFAGLGAGLTQGGERARQGIRMQFADLIGSGTMQADAMQKRSQASFRESLATPEIEDPTLRGIYSGVQSTLAQIPGVAASILMRHPSVALGSMGLQVEADAYGKYRERGATALEALTGGVGEGGVEVLTEMIPMGFLVKQFGKTGAGDFLKGLVGKEIWTEQLATAAQDAIDTAIANPDKSWGQYLAERPEAAYQTLVATVTQASIMGGANALATYPKRQELKFQRDARQAQRTLEAEQTLTQLIDAVAQTQSIQRNPQDVADLISEADESGQTEVFINARQFANVFNQSAIETAERLGIDTQSLNDALTSNGDLTVPLASLATAVAQDESLRPVLEHTRVDPGDMSPSEARLWQSSQGEQFKAEAETVLAQRQADEVYQTEVQGVYDNLLGQLNTARRFMPQVNERYASMVKDFYVTMADRAGMSVNEMAARYPLNVVATGVGGLEQSKQPKVFGFDQTLTEAFKRWSNDAPLITSEAGGTHDFKSGEKVVLESYHGAKRPDRVGTKFLKKRATSGPMAYHTSSPELASGYATSKSDTSLADEDNHYAAWFKWVPPGSRSPVDIVRAWYFLDGETKAKIREIAPTLRNDDTGENVIAEEGNTGGNGSYDYNLQQSARKDYMRQGNPLEALVEDWLNSGVLYNNEELFMQVLQKAGFPTKDVTYDSPHSEFPFVYKNYIAMQKPLATGDIPQEVRNALNAAAKKDRSRRKYQNGADMWDKDTRTLKEWVENFNDPDNKNAAMVWTSIPDKVTEVFKSLGYDGIIDYSGKGGGHAHPVYIPFEETQVKSAIGNKGTFDGSKNDILKQDARGSFDPTTNTIALLDGADLSTFLHESGHFFLEVMADMATRPNAAPVMRADFDTLLGWFGVTGTPEADAATSWHLMSLDEKRQFHEQFARGFEAYLFEGTAPSVEMQGIFQRFRAWLTNVYESLKALDVTLTDDVRGVFDRMLASDEAIKTAEAVRNFAPVFQTPEQAGMTAEEWAQYQGEAKEASDNAVSELQTRSIRDMRWLTNAKARKIKDLQATAKAVRNDVMMGVRREVLSEPIYMAWQFLTGKNPDKIAKLEKTDPGAIDPTKDTLLVAIAKMGGLDREQAVKEWGLDSKDDTKADNPGGKTMVTRKGGMKIDDMRMALEEWGYLPDSSDPDTDPKIFEEMFFDALRGGEYYSQWGEEAMIAAEERKSKRDPEEGITLENTPAGKLNTGTLRDMYGIEDTAPWRLLSALKMTSPEGFQPDIVANLFGFTSGDELVRRLAVAEDPKVVIEAITDQRMLEQHGDLASEADIERAAERAIHNDVRARVLTRELNALRKATGQAPIMLKAARLHADTWLARQLVKNATRHAPHAAAESRSAKATMDALAKGDTASAAIHKRDQVLNNQLARGALRAQDEVEKAVRYLKKFDKKGTRKALDGQYLDQIDQLLERFDLRQVSGKALQKRASLRAWLDDQEALGIDPVIDARLVEDAQRQHYSTLTLEEFRGLVDSVKSIEHMGRLKNRLLTAQDKREFAKVVTELSESIVDNANRTAKDKNPITAADKVQRALIELGAHHRKFASFAREMDGGKDGGPMWEYLLRSMNAAGDQEASMRADLSKKLADLFLGIKKVKLNEKVFVPELNISLRREEILAIALNAGNKGNVQRLMDGGINDSLRAINVQQLMGVLNRVSNQEWDFVEGVWGLIEANRPAIAAQEKALTGVEPAWIEPDSFTLASGRVIRGGYYPAKYNGLFSTRSAELEAVTDLRLQTKGAMGNSSTRNGFTKQRAEEVSGRPLKLDLNVIAQHINEVTHRLAWQSWLIDARRLLKAPAIETAIKQHYGVAALNEMKQHLQDIATGDQEAQDAWGRIANHLRTGTTIVGMGWNIMTALAQPVGITQSIERVGAKWIGKGMKTFVTNPMQATANVQQVSPFMHNRALTMNREINDVLNTVRNEKLSVIESSYFLMIQKFQQMVDVPTWLGAYEKAVAEGNNDERAIALADQAVLDSQGGGQIKDLAGMQKGNEYKKLFTNFYSFFNVLHQRMVENYRATDPRNPLSVGKTAGNYLLLFVLPTVWMMALKEALRGDDDDDDELLAKYAKEQLSYIMGTTIMGRELASAMSDFDYRGPTGLRFFVEFGKLYKQSMQGEVDMPWFKAFMNTAGTLLHFPAGQITRMVDGANAYIDGNAGPQAVLVGPPLKN
jgi:hypothetical protein